MNTRHFDAVDWLDLARGVARPSDRVAMDRHLAGGCARCTKRWDLARSMVAAAATPMMEPPPGVVRRAEAIFSAQTLHQPARGVAGLRLAARLLFDSFQAPVPVGVRSARRLDRQVVYRAGDYEVDLRLEYGVDATTLAVVGQVVNQRNPDQPVVGTGARLVAGTSVVARAEANEFGEFALSGAVAPRLRLEVPVDAAGHWVDVPLGRLSVTAEPSGRRRRVGTAKTSRKGVRK